MAVSDKKLIYIMEWQKLNKDKVKNYQYKVRQNPDRKAKEQARLFKRGLITKEYNRIKHLGGLFL